MVTLTIRDIVLNDAGLYQAELTDAEPTQFLNFQIDVRKFIKLLSMAWGYIVVCHCILHFGY